MLLATAGAIEGRKFKISADEVTLLGRSSKGLEVPDPLVSLQHARIEFTVEGFVLTDLDSAKGTYINEKRLRGASQPLEPGMEIRLGETVFEVGGQRAISTRWAVLLAAVLGVGALLSVCMGLLMGAPTGHTVLKWVEPVRQGGDGLPSPEIEVPQEFLRARAIDFQKLRIRRVTDFDYNGRDEVWLRYARDEYVATFDEQGRWVDLGELPAGCLDRDKTQGGTNIDGFPLEVCSGRLFMFIEGAYRVVQHDGVVVWTEALADPEPEPEPEPADGVAPALPDRKPGELAAFRVTLRHQDRLAGFLAQRGIDKPLHYLICEDAFDGVKAQVLTEQGRLQELGFGCLKDVSISGEGLGRVVAVAFTAAGHDALVNDVNTFYGGSPEGLFLDPRWRSLLDVVESDPGFLRGASKLRFEGTPQYFRAMAAEEPVPGGRRLLPTTLRAGFAPLAVTATLMSEGRNEIDPPGCSLLQADVEPWLCALSRGCLPSSKFVRVREVGCGEPRDVLSVSYGSHVADGGTDELEVRMSLDTRRYGDRVDVLRARLSYRMKGGAGFESN